MPTGIAQGQVRNSGEAAADEEARKAAAEFDQEIRVELPREESQSHDSFRTPGFSRMRMEWRSQDRPVIQQAQAAVEGRVRANFRDAYEIINSIYDIVREPQVGSDGKPLLDRHGYTMWKQTPSGSYEEDFSKLTRGEKERFLLQITTRAFAWEQLAADAWAEAMFAKGMWEEQYGIEYSVMMASKATMGDREAMGAREAADERYFAIFVSYYSRRADAIVRVMDRLAQRLRDALSF